MRGHGVSEFSGGKDETTTSRMAKGLGFYDVVQLDGWGGITARSAGSMVKRAVEIAEHV